MHSRECDAQNHETACSEIECDIILCLQWSGTHVMDLQDVVIDDALE
ncbi:hypothetical protein URH17368_2854 [Alicyclobacillus hesperidum URH17-3-68]|nr:hypothetical protein URH17368_2854 [Alicyclobacillus hesperidum URH17-3-68]